MGCSKTAQALITKFNYEERGMKVLLLKPSVDVRDGEEIVKSRIGLTAKAVVVNDKEDLYKAYEEKYRDRDVIIVAVPTPDDKYNRPDLTPLYKASRTAGETVAYSVRAAIADLSVEFVPHRDNGLFCASDVYLTGPACFVGYVEVQID